MSERGSFCTQYIYCEACFNAAKQYLLDKDKFLCSQIIETWEVEPNHLPIIAGKIGSLGRGGEIVDMLDLIKNLETNICHPLRVAVLAESGEQILTATPLTKGGEK